MLIKDIICSSCSSYFEFGLEEQAFYETKGFQPPKKCKPCRDSAKQFKNKQSTSDYGEKQYADNSRKMYDTFCSSCNVSTQVPFQPDGSRPVYCQACYKSNAAVVKGGHG